MQLVGDVLREVAGDLPVLGDGFTVHPPEPFTGSALVAEPALVVESELSFTAESFHGYVGTLEWIRRQWQHARVRYVSDSEYLVKGVTEWTPAWKRQGWRRKGGALENLELWQKLDQVLAAHEVEWGWVRGHNDNPKNDYADHLATTAAERQERSNGLVPSGFDTWLAQQRARGRYADYDPDREIP